MRPKRDHQFNGLECLSAVVALCRRELSPAAPCSTTVGLEAEILRLQLTLRQRECECAEHLATIHQLRQTRDELEQKLSSAEPSLFRTVLPEIPIDPRGKDAGEWHLVARTLQTHLNTYKRALDSKSKELIEMKGAYQTLMSMLSARDKENALAAAAPADCSSSEAP